MKEGAIDRERAVVADDQAPEVSEPGVGAFDNPSPSIAPQRSAILSCGPKRFLLCGQINSMPRRRKRFRSGSLS